MPFDPVVLPDERQDDAEFLVAASLRGDAEPAGPALDRVTSWCEVHSDESGLYSPDHGDGFPIVWWRAEVGRWSDSEIAFEVSADVATLTDDRRVRFLRSRFAGSLEGQFEDADRHPTGCEIIIESAGGGRASLCFLLSGYSFGDGPRIEWWGVYASIGEFRDAVRVCGGLTNAAEVAALSDLAILQAWQSTHSSNR